MKTDELDFSTEEILKGRKKRQTLLLTPMYIQKYV